MPRKNSYIKKLKRLEEKRIEVQVSRAGRTQQKRRRKPTRKPKRKKQRVIKPFPPIKGKPRVLMLADVKGWGAWTRGEYIRKHLSDEFQFSLVDWQTFNDDSFKRIKHGDWDIFFPLLHIFTRYSKSQRLADVTRTITTVTSRKILKPSYGSTQAARLKRFRQHTANVDLLIVNNLLVKPDAEKWFHGPVKYAPRGVDPEVFKFIKYPNEERFAVFYVGKEVPEKGLRSIIKPICHRNRKEIKIMINNRNFVTALPEKKMAERYNDSNVYIVASTIDGTPNPALEAASCGRPIISNEIGNMPEFIKHGVNGFMVKREKKEYEHRLLQLSRDRDLAYEMGQQARKTVLEDWTWDILLNKNQRVILRELLKKEKK